MKLWLKLIIALALIGTGVGVWLWLNRKNSATTHPWAISDALQGSQLSLLSSQLSDKLTREQVLSLIAENSTGGGTTTIVTTTSGPDILIPITSNGQTAFTVDAGETRKKLFLNGIKLKATDFTLAPPNLTYLSSVTLETDDVLELAY